MVVRYAEVWLYCVGLLVGEVISYNIGSWQGAVILSRDFMNI